MGMGVYIYIHTHIRLEDHWIVLELKKNIIFLLCFKYIKSKKIYYSLSICTCLFFSNKILLYQ